MTERGTYDAETSTEDTRKHEPEDNLDDSRDGYDADGLDDHDQNYDHATIIDERGLDDPDLERGLDDPDLERGAHDPDPDRGAAYPECDKALNSFLDDKNLAYREDKTPNGQQVERISMLYRGTEAEPGLADITSKMREELGYSQGRNDVQQEHVDVILDRVLGSTYRNDSMESRYNRAQADLSQHGQRYINNKGELVHPASEFEYERNALYGELRNKVADDLLNGGSSTQEAFQKYQDHLNQGAKEAAEAKSTDYYQILGVTPDATKEEISLGRREAAQQYHGDKHPYPEYNIYMQGANLAHEALSDPTRRAAYDNTRQEPSSSYEGESAPTNDEGAATGSDIANQEEGSTTSIEAYDGSQFSKDDPMLREAYDGSQFSKDDPMLREAADGPKEIGTDDQDIKALDYPFGKDDPMLLEWTPEKDANWHKENEEKQISWLEHLMLIIAEMIAHAVEQASNRTYSAEATDKFVSNYLSRPRGESSQAQHIGAMRHLGNTDENVAMHFAISDQDEAENVRDLTDRTAQHLSQYPMQDETGTGQRMAGEPSYERVVNYDPDTDEFEYETGTYAPIEGLEWDNPDHTMDQTILDSLTGDDEQAMANRQHLSEMLKERVNWIQGNDAYVDFNEPSNSGRAEELLNQYDQNQTDLGLRRDAIEPALLWNAENSMGGIATYIERSIEEQRELTELEVRFLADTIRHCDYMINATGQAQAPRRNRG